MAEDKSDKKTSDGKQEVLLNPTPSSDDKDKAEALKAEANTFFKDEKFQQAADLYSQVRTNSAKKKITNFKMTLYKESRFAP